MNLSELIKLTKGNLLTKKPTEECVISGAMAADLMSDVLASIKPEAVLLTGLCNPQVVRTATIADIRAIVFVRGKYPDPDTVLLANEENIPLIITDLGLFEACGILYQAGLPSFELKSPEDSVL